MFLQKNSCAPMLTAVIFSQRYCFHYGKHFLLTGRVIKFLDQILLQVETQFAILPEIS